MSGCCGQSPVIVNSPNPRVDGEPLLLCDVATDGTTTQFLRHVVYDQTSGAVVSTSDTTLDGTTPYTPVGEVSQCTESTSSSVDVETWPLCIFNTDGSVLQHVRAEQRYDADGNASRPPMLVDSTTGSPVSIPGGATIGVCPGPETCARQILERCGCDDTDGDGIGDVTYTELWAVDPCNGEPPELVGTYLDGDLTQPYVPVAPVECTAGEPIEADPLLLCDSGTPFLRHVRYDGNGTPVGVVDTAVDGTTPYTVTGTVGTCTAAPTADAPVRTGVQRLTGGTSVPYGANFPGLQSVTMTVVSGEGLATMNDGANVSIPVGASLSWSVTDADDSSLDIATIGAAAGGDVLVNWTWKDTDAG